MRERQQCGLCPDNKTFWQRWMHFSWGYVVEMEDVWPNLLSSYQVYKIHSIKKLKPALYLPTLIHCYNGKHFLLTCDRPCARNTWYLYLTTQAFSSRLTSEWFTSFWGKPVISVTSPRLSSHTVVCFPPRSALDTFFLSTNDIVSKAGISCDFSFFKSSFRLFPHSSGPSWR